MEIRKFISITIRRYLNENIKQELNLDSKYINDLKQYLSKFNTDEELLRSGGLPNDLLDRLAFGFCEDDIKTINPDQLKIKWKDDLANVKYEIKQSGLSPKQWASKINLSEPIDVAYWEDKRHKLGFYIEDGHHRYVASKILNKSLNVNLEIKANPITRISPELGYDQFHRYIFSVFK